MTSKIPSVPIFWTDQLYAPALQASINKLFADNRQLLGIFCNHKTGRFADRGYRIYEHRGSSTLSLRSGRIKMEQCTASRLLQNPLSDHAYSNCLWIGEEEHDRWKVMLHRDIVLIQPWTAKARRLKAEQEDHGVAILARPRSQHDRLQLEVKLQRFEVDASAYLRLATPGGIALRDPSDSSVLRTLQPRS